MRSSSKVPTLWLRARSRRPAVAAHLERIVGRFEAAGWRVDRASSARPSDGGLLAVLDDAFAAPTPELASALARAEGSADAWRLPGAPGAPEPQGWDVSTGPFTERDDRRRLRREVERSGRTRPAPPGAWTGFAVLSRPGGAVDWPPDPRRCVLVEGLRCYRYEDPADHPRHELDRYLPPGPGLWVEIGCGGGAFAGRHRDGGRRWIGVEPDLEMAGRARERLDLVLACGAEEALRALPEGLAGAVLADVVEHLEHPFEVLAALAKQLAPEGRAVVAFPNVAWAPVLLSLAGGRWDPTLAGVQARDHRLPTTPDSFADLARDAGFEVERLEPLPAPRLPLALRLRARLVALAAGASAEISRAPQWVAVLRARAR
ncbi:MAG: methyltransferase domain-containing protein [Acidobacteria bacterium]|nr:methyltransferase domain-containing protein [Acidobacteriota bacterium]MCB9377511.1 methyltransferase domain-containing protein [Holophagales bacterium]